MRSWRNHFSDKEQPQRVHDLLGSRTLVIVPVRLHAVPELHVEAALAIGIPSGTGGLRLLVALLRVPELRRLLHPRRGLRLREGLEVLQELLSQVILILERRQVLGLPCLRGAACSRGR